MPHFRFVIRYQVRVQIRVVMRKYSLMLRGEETDDFRWFILQMICFSIPMDSSGELTFEPLRKFTM